MQPIPTPTEASALRLGGLLRTDEIPAIAAQWLVDEDGESLRRLAGTDGSDVWEIDRLWPLALAELGVVPLVSEAAWKQLLSYYQRGWRSGHIATESVIRDLARYFESNDYPSWALEASWSYGDVDELDCGWGRSRAQIIGDAERMLGGRPEGTVR